MKQAIKKLVLSLFPELVGGYHLLVKARIEAIAGEPTQNSLCDQFRPYYAVDVMPLLPTGEPDERLGILQGLELPYIGHSFALPKLGQFVELAFFNGLPSQPFIRSIRPEGELLPQHARGETVTHHSLESFNKIDSAGNHHRKTQGQIHDEALRLVSEALEFIGKYKSRSVTNTGDDSEDIKGSKLIEALGTLALLSGENMSLGTLKKLELLAKQAASLESEVSATIKAPKISIGDGSNELLSLLNDLITQVNTLITDVTALQALFNSHAHANSGADAPATKSVVTTANVVTIQAGLSSILKS
ncbi:MAG: hypothetical protein OXE99_00145 [Cellvibrionales bacterium]|nr:hypothetical protein [Cellvibrionales bacterium]